jgi:hypothetical protein
MPEWWTDTLTAVALVGGAQVIATLVIAWIGRR